MLTKLKDYFANNMALDRAAKSETAEHNIQVATCALLIEMASIDSEFDSQEKSRIVQYFRDEYGLPEARIDELFALAQNELDTRIDLWGLTNLINQHYDNSQKIKVIEIVWEVIYADGKLSAHEDYLIHKLYKMLNLAHGDMIEAKMRALEKYKKSQNP